MEYILQIRLEMKLILNKGEILCIVYYHVYTVTIFQTNKIENENKTDTKRIRKITKQQAHDNNI